MRKVLRVARCWQREIRAQLSANTLSRAIGTAIRNAATAQLAHPLPNPLPRASHQRAGAPPQFAHACDMTAAALAHLGAPRPCKAPVPRPTGCRRPLAARRALCVRPMAQGDSEAGAQGPGHGAAATGAATPAPAYYRQPQHHAWPLPIHCFPRTTPAGVPPALTLSKAFEALGLAEGASYDEVLSAKNRLLEAAGGTVERKMEVGAGWGVCWVATRSAT